VQGEAGAVNRIAQRRDIKHQPVAVDIQAKVSRGGGEKAGTLAKGKEQAFREAAEGIFYSIKEEELVRLNNAIKYIQNEYQAWK